MVSLQPGDTLLCLVWSLTNKNADDPYSLVLKPGAKPRIVCTCPRFIYAGGKTCKHIGILKSKVKDGSILSDDNFKLTTEGKTHFKVG